MIYPIGIPTPWVDPDIARPARPGDWSSPVAGYYYINHATGTNTGRTYGTPTAPRKTIPSPLPAGSYVEIEGNYNQTSSDWFITGNGDSGSWVANTSGPVWVVGLDANTRWSYNGNLFIVGSYVYLEFFDNFVGHKALNVSSVTDGIGRHADHILIRNFEIEGTSSSTDGARVKINGNSDAVTGTTEDVIIWSGHVHNSGIDDPDGSDPDKVGIYVTDYVERAWILDNEIHDMSGSAIAITANTSSTYRTRDIYIGRNHCYDLWGTGIGVKSAEDVVISQNTVHDIQDNSPVSPSKGISGQYAASGVWVIFNHIYNAAHGVMRVSGNDVGETMYIVGNLIHDITVQDGAFTNTGFGEGAIALWGAEYKYIVGNTIYNAPNGIVAPSLDTIVIENNVISTINEANGEAIYIASTGGSPSLVVRNNNIYQSGGEEILIPGRSVDTIATLEAAALGSGNLAGDPLFVSDVGDWSLTETSPGVDAGLAPASLTLDVYDLFETTFGVSIEKDFLNRSRPAGSGWDIGAFEFGATDATAPTCLSVTVGEDGETVTLLMDEVCTATGDVPTLTMTGGAVTLTYDSGTGTTELAYSTSRVITLDETGTASYTQPGDGIEDADGNDLESFTGKIVSNQSEEAPDYPMADVLTLNQTANTDPVTELWLSGPAPDGPLETRVFQHSGNYPQYDGTGTQVDTTIYRMPNGVSIGRHGTAQHHVFVFPGTITLAQAIASRP